MNKRIEEIIRMLDLQPHPEGGYYKETYRSEQAIQQDALPNGYSGDRNHSTCIYFLLTSGNFSAFHKINQDEIWHFYEGSPVELHTISPSGAYQKHLVGNDFSKGETPQLVVAGGDWFASSVSGEDTYALVGCTVAPGFDFADFILADREKLAGEFPQHESIIQQFTR